MFFGPSRSMFGLVTITVSVVLVGCAAEFVTVCFLTIRGVFDIVVLYRRHHERRPVLDPGRRVFVDALNPLVASHMQSILQRPLIVNGCKLVLC